MYYRRVLLSILVTVWVLRSSSFKISCRYIEYSSTESRNAKQRKWRAENITAFAVTLIKLFLFCTQREEHCVVSKIGMARVCSERNRQQETSTSKDKKELISQRRQLQSVGLCHMPHYCQCNIKMSTTYLLIGTQPTTLSMEDTSISVKEISTPRHTRSWFLKESTRMRVNVRPIYT